MASSSPADREPSGAFATLAGFAIRFRWPIVALWIVVVVGAISSLPSLSSVSKANNAQFLSSSAPSVQAARLAAPFQGASTSASATAIIVASRESAALSAADDAAIARAERAARGVPGVTLVKDEGRSKDRKAAQALVTVSTQVANSGSASKRVVESIRAGFARVGAPPGLSLHLAGPLAVNVDSSSTRSGSIAAFTLIFVIVLLFVVYRAALAPIITLVPAVMSFLLAGPLVAEAAKAGLSMPSVAQQLLIVLVIGAGSDYGLFLSFRVREELTHGLSAREALVAAMAPVGEAITYSALTVAAALLTLLLASFAIYRGLGPALAIGVGVLLVCSLTLTPALLAIFGRAAFWPSHPSAGSGRLRLWGRLAERVVRYPVPTLLAGVVLFGALAAGLVGYRTAGLTSSSAPAGSDSAAGAQALAAHFPKASVGSDQLLLTYPSPVSAHPAALEEARHKLASNQVFRSVGAPLVSADGRTLQLYAVLRAGPVGSTAAADAIPQARAALSTVAQQTGASANGIAGQDASAHDINAASTSSLELVVPVVLVLILVLLAVLLRSLVAPWYMALTVGLSYLASLGFAMTVFVHLGGNEGLIFVLPLLLFVFSMALGEDYNILVMSRIREEAGTRSYFRDAVTHAIGITGGTVTSAGLILAGTFAVLGLVGGSSEAQQLGFGIAFGVLLDTFFVRTLLIPSIAVLLGPRNWWPSKLSRRDELLREPVGRSPAVAPRAAGSSE